MSTKRFVKVRDTNRKPLRGLWQRGGRYYLQIKTGLTSPRRIALEATNLSEAKLAAEEKRREAREGDLPARGRKPTFAELADACLAIAATKKKSRTVKEDAHRLRRWKVVFGHVRVDLITTAMIAKPARQAASLRCFCADGKPGFDRASRGVPQSVRRWPDCAQPDG